MRDPHPLRLPAMRRLRSALLPWAIAALMPANAIAGAAQTLAVLPIKLLDTSGEPRAQEAEHAHRLEAMAASLAIDLDTPTLYRTTRLDVDRIRHCSGREAACVLEAARATGADLVFVGVVHKSSTLILQMWVRIVDLRTDRELFSRDLNFRGDTDDAWRRAEAFLVDQIRDQVSRH